jgi:3-hydroxypropionyl-CoA synthetase (ADP-forming)
METQRILSQAIEDKTRLLPEDVGKSLMNSYGIKVPRGRRVADSSELRALGAEWSYPLVAKALVPGLLHKSDQGAVRVGLESESSLLEAAEELWRLFPEASLLVEEMAPEGIELIAGLIHDTHFGPFLMIGIGGIFTELFQDVGFVMLPATRNDILLVLKELKGFKLLTGFRGGAVYDIEPVVDALMALARFGEEAQGYYESVDVNPIRVSEHGVTALDVKILLKPEFMPLRDEAPSCDMERFKRFFYPSSVAIIGASATPGKPGHEVIRNILDNKYQGKIYLVNPKGGELLGLPVHPSISGLPKGIDLGIILLSAKDTPQALRACAEQGIGQVVLSAGGFAEVDEGGVQIQGELINILRETGVRTLGPNTSGHTSTPHHFTSTFFPLGEIRRGRVSYVAQTGNFATHTMKYILTGEHFGVARVIGLGNKIDIEESTALEYLGEDPETKAIIMYLESIKYPRKFLETAQKVTRKKPVIMLKGGSTEAGRHAAVAHTAAMAAEDRLVDAMLRQAGIVRIWEYTDLITAGKALSMASIPRGNRVSFLAPSGAILVVLSDLCTRLGLQIPDLEPENLQRLQEISPSYIRMRNPVDIWAAASVRGVEAGYREGMEAVFRDPNIDAVVPILLVMRDTVPSLEFIVELAEKYPEKPLFVAFAGDKEVMDECRDFLEPRGIATFPEIEQPFRALSILCRCNSAMNRPS